MSTWSTHPFNLTLAAPTDNGGILTFLLIVLGAATYVYAQLVRASIALTNKYFAKSNAKPVPEVSKGEAMFIGVTTMVVRVFVFALLHSRLGGGAVGRENSMMPGTFAAMAYAGLFIFTDAVVLTFSVPATLNRAVVLALINLVLLFIIIALSILLVMAVFPGARDAFG